MSGFIGKHNIMDQGEIPLHPQCESAKNAKITPVDFSLHCIYWTLPLPLCSNQ